MKKIVYLMAFTAILATSCNTKDEPFKNDDNTQTSDVITITGSITEDSLTKTSYDFSDGTKGVFSWVSTDIIALIVKNKTSDDPVTYDLNNINRFQLTTSASAITDEGKTATFTGLLDHNTSGDQWLSTGFAVYPVALSQINSNSGYNAVFVKLPSTTTGAADQIYLVGTPNDVSNPTNFDFKTAMGVFQITLNNLSGVKYVRLVTSDKTQYPLDGDFKLEKGSDGIVSIGKEQFLPGWVSYFAGYLQADVSSKGNSATLFFNIPINTYPANTLSIQTIASDGSVIETKTIKTDIVVKRGEVYPLPTLNLSINKVNLTADMLSVNSDTSTGGGTGWYDGGGVSKLLDGDVSTYWHSAYGTWYEGDDYNSATAFDSTYGIYIQVALTEALQNFHVEYVTRANNGGRPRAIVYGGSNDGSTWTILGTCSDSSMDVAGNIRVALPVVKAATPFTYLRFGIISSGTGENDLRTGGGSTNLAEFALYKHL